MITPFSPARERSAAVNASELSGKSITFFTIDGRVFATKASDQQIVDLTGERELQLALADLQLVGKRNHRNFIPFVPLNLGRLMFCWIRGDKMQNEREAYKANSRQKARNYLDCLRQRKQTGWRCPTS